jgi:uncharacterized membrane protein YccC
MSGTPAAPLGPSSLPGAGAAPAPGSGAPGRPHHRLSAILATTGVKWSPAAALRALRAVIVIPTLFALTSHVLDNPQAALFATFGGFAATVLAGSFGGGTRDKLAAHAVLAVGGSALLVVGTAVAGHPLAASLVTVPVAFFVLVTGAAGSNAAIGAPAALVAYVLPAASPGAIGMVPDRLAGWWMASLLATVLAIVLAPRPVTSRLQMAAAASASELATTIESALASPGAANVERVAGADGALVEAFTTAPYRPTGLAVADQALAKIAETLQWCASLVVGLLREQPDLSAAPAADRDLLAASAHALATTAGSLQGTGGPPGAADLPQPPPLDTARGLFVDREGRGTPAAVHVAFHARLLLAAVRELVADARLVARRTGKGARSAAPAERAGPVGPGGGDVLSPLAFALRIARGNTSLRSVWAQNAVRGAVAIAAAVAIADNTDVQHGFWVVLGALSVLRTSATSTGANAWRAVVGTALGFFVGAALIIGIGVGSAALWAAFVLAVLVAAYTPGTAPFAAGQAAFTVLLTVLYNLLEPVGWKVGVYRLEDVAIGAGLSVLIGALLWPRGATKVAANDLADALEQDGTSLVESTAWAVGLRQAPPTGQAAQLASGRLDDAVRSVLVERGAVGREEVWQLVGGAARLRLIAASLAATPPPRFPATHVRQSLLEESVALAGRCERLATRVGAARASVLVELADLEPSAEPARVPAAMWVRHHLLHVRRELSNMEGRAEAFTALRHRPWWR